MPTDRLQKQLVVGNRVLIPAIITSLTEGTQPTVNVTTVYKGFDGNTDAIATLDAIQVIKDE